ncbi:DHHC zinc finger domain containing protein [Entamoeba histolytica HM-1:IMSS-B]|uniref:Palmitoyltransferase n=6 Tax=Entamoeba histolytica TaxID=5759 RepID=C4M135_ENTH1|nr:hypothetical protein EHI_105310 [Entamoeba histolytica HM-1:IMSS]EAL48555.1 hypothetical protein EHI_105310 [Entamoeba histolytica HM-1:IMSS]EMD42466.1 zinc finger protein DHHC domain containing protein [Entamoeba histolytica KU27]EMH76293.1 DHHC zinc finger domain containing protein [Entamoeba histolytica HM-1:IMSS-B]ENY64576.1 zinc finger protein DHHC domain containing protein [Entamoeba histolytica HM-1:IMSS-A]|eukprot:XP_653942.1 hypothetical protein EHI_105310 [Entamoeba histolytica HM-1:IMSS]
MLVINYINPHNKDYNKYNYWIGPIRKVFANSHTNTKNLDVNAIDKNVFFDKNYSLDFCLKCNTIKQPRVTHCDICGTCILRHDHHSILLQTCIGQHNYLYYYLFVLFTVITTGLNCIIFLLFQFKKLHIECRLISLGFLFGNISILFEFYQNLKTIVYQLQFNFTCSEYKKYLNSRRMHCQYHYDTGKLTTNIHDAFY